VSLSWRDRIQIVLCPQRVILVRLGRGLKLKVQDKAVLPCGEAAAGMPPWQPALAALQEALAGPQWRNAEVRVILSNHFVRYLLIDWDESLTGYDEQLAMVRFRFAQTYGEPANTWDYRWNEGYPPAPCVACAIDPPLLAGLRELFGDAGLHLTLAGVQPYLMAAFNHWRNELDGQRDWFLLAEPERLCLSWFQADEWAGLHSQQVDQSWGRDLPQILERVMLLAGATRAPERLCIHAPEASEAGLVLGEGWSGKVLRLQPCPGFVPAKDTAYAMAMNA
jgi:hypothetical protein